MNTSKILALFTCFGIISCGNDMLTSGEYIKYVESGDHGLRNSREIGDMQFHLQYCPTEYLLLSEYTNEVLSKEIITERQKENEGLHFFRLRIATEEGKDVLNHDVTSADDYYERIQYLSYGFEENVAIINNSDTIFPALFHFERTYGISPFADFIMAFDTELGKSNDFQVIIDDHVFNTGILKFSFDCDEVLNAPALIPN